MTLQFNNRNHLHAINVSACYGHSGTSKIWEDNLVLPVSDSQLDQKELTVQAQFELLGTNRSVVVLSKFECVCRVLCDRCARPFDLPLSGSVEEEFLKEVDWEAEDSFTPSFKDFPFKVDEYQQIDLDPLIHQGVFLALPPVNHCHQADCQVPQIGESASIKTDARWEKLKELLERE
jgi:uncharacterized metal-binding protein YceD (DUF177 family)